MYSAKFSVRLSLLTTLCASALVAGCALHQGSERVALAANPQDNPAVLAEVAAHSLQSGDSTTAQRLAELAVAADRTDTQAQLVLARTYLAQGRFGQAADLFVAIPETDSRSFKAKLGLAMAKLGAGYQDEAVKVLTSLAKVVGPDMELASDVGLALALANQPTMAIDLLEAVVRQPTADARARQNLALAYALNKDWTQAKTIAAIDLTESQIEAALSQWSKLAVAPVGVRLANLMGISAQSNPTGPETQVASLEPRETQSALSTPSTVQDQEAPVVASEPVNLAPVPVTLASLESLASSVGLQDVTPVALPVVATAQVAEPTEEAAPEAAAPSSEVSAPATVASASVPTTVRFSPVSGKPSVEPVAASLRLEATPDQTSETVAATPNAPKANATAVGEALPATVRWVVQLAAYRFAETHKNGWRYLQTKYASVLGGMGATLSSSGTQDGLYRLSVGDYQERVDALRLCRQLRRSGGKCLIRPNPAGDVIQVAAVIDKPTKSRAG